MDQQWRHRPIQGNICPTCSISHFPFCPPRQSFDQNPRYPSETDFSFQRPGFDRYGRLAGPDHPNNGFEDPRSWQRNPNLGRNLYGSDMYTGIHRDGCAPTSYDYGYNGFVSGGNRNSKRTRVDDMESGASTNEFYGNLSKIVSEEDERRLKLIRDHGFTPSGPPQVGANSMLRTSIGYNCEIVVSERGSSNTGFGEHVKFDDFQGARGEIASELPSNTEMNNFWDPGVGSRDRKGALFYRDNDFHHLNRREEHGSVSAKQYMYHDRNKQDGFPTSVPNNLEHQSHNAVVRQSTDWGDNYYSRLPTGNLEQLSSHDSRGFNDVYRTHNVQQLQSKDPMLAKETQFSHHSNWRELSTPYHEQSNISVPNTQLQPPFVMRQSFDIKGSLEDGNWVSSGHHDFSVEAKYGPPNPNKQGSYLPIPGSMVSDNLGHVQPSHVSQPPLPASPPPPLPLDPSGHPSSHLKALYSPPKTLSSLFPIHASSSAALVASLNPPVPDAHSLAKPHFHNQPHLPVSTGFVAEESHAIHRTLSNQYLGEGQSFPLKQFSSDKPKVINASHLFKHPHRATRPDHLVIILRGLPGSGKSYLAKLLRDIEIENGGGAPRIHSMDDYFMTEVEKVEESEISKSFSLTRGKKPSMKKVMEYCYEPEMEEAYRSSMLKAFKKTLEEGIFTFVIVDDRNLRVADFAQFWAIAKRSGYEVYILEATYKDPAGCAARNVHGFTQDDIQKMAGRWEEAPSLYLQLDSKSLFSGDDLKESGIQEVEMDMEDDDLVKGLSGLKESEPEKIISSTDDHASDVSSYSKKEKRWDFEGDHSMEEVKVLGRSKWSDDLEEDDAERKKGSKANISALSGLIQAYGKEGKSVHWGDRVGNTGFSIGATRKVKKLSLVIGPGAGYNLSSNPLPEEEKLTLTANSGGSKKQSIFQERQRAEQESSKAVFDRRRHRIGLDVDEE